jgi:PAS domain S-box-containing protein
MTTLVKTLLLVEDHDLVAAYELRQLRALGYTVIHVSSGERAIDTVFRSRMTFDLILMDVDLGKSMSGVSAAQIISTIFDIPIIFLSSHAEHEIVESTEKVSSYGYVFKGSGIAVLSTTITTALRMRARFLAGETRTLNLHENRYLNMLPAPMSPLAIVMWDLDFIITLWSDEAERIFAHTAKDAVGQTIDSLKLITAGEFTGVYRDMGRLVCGEERTIVFSMINHKSTGDAVACYWFNAALSDKSGAVESVVSLIQQKPIEIPDGVDSINSALFSQSIV